MSTIRPLATIAVLAVIGVFLAHQINKGPAVAMQDDWLQSGADDAGEPPVWDGTAGGAAPAAVEAVGLGEATDSSLTARSAPSWAEVPSDAETAKGSTPSFPTLPDLPPPASEPTPDFDSVPPILGKPAGTELANEAGTNPTFPTTTGGPLPLPTQIPQANYGGTNYGDQVPSGVSGSVPSLGASTTGPSTLDAASTGASAAPGFDTAWEAVQASLERGELTRAHQMLSQWRAEPALAPNQQQRVDTLLGQLAGSVIYSTDHRLEPPHLVAPGETLTTIAQKYDIPWQLLAKINGVAAADGVQAGQALKVLRGPFQAEVDLARGEFVLLLGDRYAGKFPVRVEGSAPSDGDWSVEQKRLDQAGQAQARPGLTPTMVFANPLGQRLELSASTTPIAGGGRLSVASNDLADLYDILSVGSSVTIRR